MSTSKNTLSARLQRKTLTLSKKMKLLDYRKRNPTIGCRDIAEIFNIGKTSAVTIIKNEVLPAMLVLKVTGNKFVRENLTE